jgi:hypothetical protein
MTVIISLPNPHMIIMTTDSRKSTHVTPVDFRTLKPIGEPVMEYTSMIKFFLLVV